MTADVATSLASWSSTAASNQPDNSDSVGPNILAENLRTIQAVVRDAVAGNGTIASATTTDLSTVNDNYIAVTGTTTITGLGTVSAGIIKVLKFAGALTFTHNGTSLILPGAANITTAAGDIAVLRSEGSGNWRCLYYFRAAALPALSGANSDITSLSGAIINTKRATVASHATTTAIWAAAGNEIDLTGTEAVTALPDAPQAGAVRVVNIASDGGTWLAGANIEIPGIASGSTYTSKAGDTLIIRAKTTTTFKIDIIPRVESGTWTVTLYDAASGGNASPTTVVGSYVRIRDEIRVEFASLNNINTTGMTGGNTLYISLPFVAASVTGLSVGSVVLNSFTYPSSRVQANPIVGAGAARARLRATASGQAAADFTVASITSGVSSISSLSLSYRV